MIFNITIGRRSFGSFCFINNIPLKNIKSNSANTNYLQHISVLLNNIKSNFAIIIIHFYFKSSFLFMINNSNKIEININNKITTIMTNASKSNFESAYNKLSELINKINDDKITSKEVIVDRLQVIQQYLEKVDEYYEVYRKL